MINSNKFTHVIKHYKKNLLLSIDEPHVNLVSYYLAVQLVD